LSMATAEVDLSADTRAGWCSASGSPSFTRSSRRDSVASPTATSGSGSGHPARLNLGDCFAYALAKDTGEPLLYKGDDFVHTDVRSVFPGGLVPD
jgi:hypothetical protein